MGNPSCEHAEALELLGLHHLLLQFALLFLGTSLLSEILHQSDHTRLAGRIDVALDDGQAMANLAIGSHDPMVDPRCRLVLRCRLNGSLNRGIVVRMDAGTPGFEARNEAVGFETEYAE